MPPRIVRCHRMIDARELAITKRLIPRIGHEFIKRRIGINRRQFLRAGRPLRFVRSRIVQSRPHLHRLPIQRIPSLKCPFQRHIIEWPLHRNTFHVNRLPIVRMFDRLGSISKMIPRLHGIPAQPLPLRRGLFAIGRKRHRPRITRHLDLPPPVPTVDEIAIGFGFGKPGDCPAQIQINTNTDRPIIQIRNVRLVRLWFSPHHCAEQQRH